jgi:hypothetical protein
MSGDESILGPVQATMSRWQQEGIFEIRLLCGAIELFHDDDMYQNVTRETRFEVHVCTSCTSLDTFFGVEKKLKLEYVTHVTLQCSGYGISSVVTFGRRENKNQLNDFRHQDNIPNLDISCIYS